MMPARQRAPGQGTGQYTPSGRTVRNSRIGSRSRCQQSPIGVTALAKLEVPAEFLEFELTANT